MNETLCKVELGQAGLYGLNLRIDKLNKRAKRHGMNELVVRVVREFEVNVEIKGLPPRIVPRFDVEIDGYAPRIDGWQLIAKIEFGCSIGTIVRISPNMTDDGSYAQYREHDGSCEHCNTHRRRNDVFVLEHSDGRRKVVGRNCLADFLRTGDAESFALRGAMRGIKRG